MTTPTELFLVVVLFASVGLNGLLWQRVRGLSQQGAPEDAQ